MKLKLLVINDTPKIHLRSLGSVNFIDAWQVHGNFVNLTKKLRILLNLTEKVSNQVCKQEFTPANSYSVPHGNNFVSSFIFLQFEFHATENIRKFKFFGDFSNKIHFNNVNTYVA